MLLGCPRSPGFSGRLRNPLAKVKRDTVGVARERFGSGWRDMEGPACRRDGRCHALRRQPCVPFFLIDHRSFGDITKNLIAEEKRCMSGILVIGSRNRKKCEEIREILGDLGLELLDLTNWPDLPEVIEDGTTFADNARKKAVEWARRLGQWVLGEDSGLVVPALGGQPGVYSARYAGQQGDDAANNARLLAELASLPDDRRAAY